MRVEKVILLSTLVIVPLYALAGDDPKPARWTESDPAFVPFDVSEIEVSADNRFVGLLLGDLPVDASLTNSTKGRASYYILDLQTGYHIRVGGADYRLDAAPTGHKFLYSPTMTTREPISLYDGLQPVRTFDVEQYIYLRWNHNSGMAVFPSRLVEGRDDFDLLAILDLATGIVTKIPLKNPTEEFWVCSTTGHFYTQNWALKPPDYYFGLDEYDANGKFIRSLNSQLADFSSHCRYVLPGQGGHGPIPWGVYDVKSGKRLMDFPWNDDDTGTVPGAWNPRCDHLLLVTTYPAEPNGATLAILDISRRRFIARWDDSRGTPPRVWSGDGKATVTIRDHRVVFDPVDLEFLAEGTPAKSP